MIVTHDIVQKLWNLRNVLRDDGITYYQYLAVWLRFREL